MGRFSLPSFSQLYTETSQNGADIEGTEGRKGYSSMEISTYTQRAEISNIQWNRRAEPALNGQEVWEVSYIVKLHTFVPLLMLGQIKRYECISFWVLRFQEIRRHHFKVLGFKQDPLWKDIDDIIAAEYDNIADVYTGYFDVILKDGDMSEDHFRRYVKEHGISTSPWGMKWDEILANENALKQAWTTVNQFIKEYISEYRSAVKNKATKMIKAEFLYPGMRARPGDAYVLNQDDNDITVKITKWRDRKVGGVAGLSQLTYPIFEHPSKKKAESVIHNYVKKLTQIPEIGSLTLHGPVVYQDVLNAPHKYVYDMPIAEAISGQFQKQFGFAADLGYRDDDPSCAPELYSGVGITPMVNVLTQAFGLTALRDKIAYHPQKYWYFSDNAALSDKLPEGTFFLDPADTFCGLLVNERRFGPVSLFTDNIKHRVVMSGRTQTQSRFLQYYMKPLVAVVNNSVAYPDSCEKYINYMVSQHDKMENEVEDYRKDNMYDWLLSKPEEHEKFQSIFDKELNIVKSYWPVTFVYNKDGVDSVRIV